MSYGDDLLDQRRGEPTVACSNCGAVFKPTEIYSTDYDDEGRETSVEWADDETCPVCAAPFTILPGTDS